MERATVTAWSRIASRIPAALLPIMLGFLLTQFGDKNGYFYTAVIVGVIAIITSFIAFAGVKEKALVNAEPSAKKHTGWRDFLSILK